MGTNFYLHRAPCESACEHCDYDPTLHVGKRSGGWTFGFRGYPELGLTSWKAWRTLINQAGGVEDEYGQTYSATQFIKEVDETRKPWGERKVTPRRRGHQWGGRVDDEGWDFTDSEFC